MEKIDRRLKLALYVQMGEGGGATESGGVMGSMGGLKSARTNVGRSFCGDLIRASATACSGTDGTPKHVHASQLSIQHHPHSTIVQDSRRAMSSIQARKDEILAKKAKLAELKRQRELRQKEFTSNRQSLDASEV